MRFEPVELFALAASQHGHFTREQALTHGMTPGEIHSRIKAHLWIPEQPKVYRHAAVPLTFEGRTWAATARTGAVASHKTAARLHALERVGETDVVEVTVLGAATPKLHDVVVHRTGALATRDRFVIRGVPVTSLARTVIEAADPRSYVRTVGLVDDALRRHGHARAWFADTAMRLMPGRHTARWVYEVTKPGAEGEFWSWLERTASETFRTGGLPEPEWNVRLYSGRRLIAIADTLWRPQLLIADLIGLRFHSSTAQRRRDAKMIRECTAEGYRVLPYTYLDLVETGESVVAELHRALGLSSGKPHQQHPGAFPGPQEHISVTLLPKGVKSLT